MRLGTRWGADAVQRRAAQCAILELTLPIAVALGDGDKLVAQDAHSARLAREDGAAPLLVMHDAGHMVHHIDPEAIAELIAPD